MSATTMKPYASGSLDAGPRLQGKGLKTPAKRILGESKAAQNGVVLSPPSSKKRKLNDELPNGGPPSSQNGPNVKLASSQPKSQFETEVLEKLTQDISGLKKANAEKDQQWERPALDDFNETRDSLCFQQIEAEEGTLPGGKVAVKLYGVSESGHSVMLHVTDFLHYLYVAAPVSFTQKDCEPYKIWLDAQLAQNQPVIYSVQMVMRENILGFQGNQKSPYLKITVSDPRYINRVRSTIEGPGGNYRGMWKGVDSGILTFDSIQYVLRFMIDTGVRADLCWQKKILNEADIWNVMGRSSAV
ncbi:MAG: hypothetical protein Q9227_008807 [Pyrenula ochraceoflavens]